MYAAKNLIFNVLKKFLVLALFHVDKKWCQKK